MKHVFYVVFIALCTMVGWSIQARADVQSIHSADNAIWAALGATRYDYKEPGQTGNLGDRELDWIASGAAGISYLSTRNTYLTLEGDVLSGDANYKGAYLLAPTTPLRGTTDERVWNADTKIGQGMALGSSFFIIPYAELGVRYWNRDLAKGQVEQYKNYDALGGSMLQFSPFSSWIFSLYGAVGATFSPQMQSDGVKYDLGSATMYKAGAKIGYDFAPRTEIFTTVDFDHFNYGQSAVINSLYEPNSRTNEVATRVGLAYHFN